MTSNEDKRKLLRRQISFKLKILKKFIISHTGIMPSSERYSKTDIEYHKRLKRRAGTLFGLAILLSVVKLADCVQKYFSKNTLVSSGNVSGLVSTGLIPWFGIVVSAVTIAFIGFALYFGSELKEEIELKYI